MKPDSIAKKAYLRYSRMKYRRPGLDRPVFFAHEIDGCPVRSLRERLKPGRKFRNPNYDRGDSREVGRGYAHGVPTGFTICLSLTGYYRAIEERLKDRSIPKELRPSKTGKTYRLCGTPDFLAIPAKDGIRVIDAKSPRRRKPDDGWKGSRRSRMMTYTRLLRNRLKERSPEQLAKLPGVLRRLTPRKIYPERLAGELSSPDITVEARVVIDSERTYHRLKLDEDRDSIHEHVIAGLTRARVGRLLLTGQLDRKDLPEELLERITLRSHPDRNRQCSYCRRAKLCPAAKDVVREVLEPGLWEPNTSKSGNRYRTRKTEKAIRATTDPAVVRANKRYPVLIQGKPESNSKRPRVRIDYREPKLPEE